MRRPTFLTTSTLFVLMLALAGCDPDTIATPQAFPTATPSPLFGGPVSTSAPATMILATVEPTITPPALTLPPALALPDASGVSVACAANTLRIPLGGGEIGAASGLMASGEWLYILADGGLYRVERAKAETGEALMEPLIAPGNVTSGRPVQELIDFDLDPATGDILLLDKAGHVYRYITATGAVGLAYRASSNRDQVDGVAAFQFVAVTVDGLGRTILLDTSRGRLWAVMDQVTLVEVNNSKALPSSADVTAVGEQFFTLQRSGALRASDGLEVTNSWRDADPRPLGLRLRTSTHLGIPLIVAVDALRREVTTYIPGGPMVTRHAFAFPDLGLLRDAVFASQHLYAVAGSDLLVYPGPASSADPAGCPDYSPDSFAPPTLYGVDVLGALRDMHPPLKETNLPDIPHLYPGAMRLYRLGVHRGTDFYGLEKGTPVTAVAAGTVAVSSTDYQDMSYDEFKRLTGDSEILGMTPPESLDRLEGRRVVIDHGGGVRTVYAHLDSIAPGIVPGMPVEAGTLIGTVGVSGTSAESRPGTEQPHLHFEIWLGGRYIGQGISIRETMWWLRRVTSPPAPSP